MGIVELVGMALIVLSSLQPVSLHSQVLIITLCPAYRQKGNLQYWVVSKSLFTIGAHLSTNYPTFLTLLRIFRKPRAPVR